MIKNLLILSLIITGFSSSNSNAAENKISNTTKFSLYSESGYRVDELQWNIASDITGTSTPNILSELTWSELEIIQYKLGVYVPIIKVNSKNLGRELYLHGYIAKGDINSGENQDSDYLGNNRTSEFSRSNNNAGSGSVEDYNININYKISIDTQTNNNFITPSLGYSLYRQNLRITDGFQTIPAEGAFSGLNSTYNSQWQSLFIGLDYTAYVKDRHQFELSGQYHYTKYYADANWNLRSDFQHPKSYEHEAYGRGIEMNFKYKFKPKKHISYDIALNFRNFTTDAGVDRTFFSSGAITETRLNQVIWQSKSIMAGLSYNF